MFFLNKAFLRFCIVGGICTGIDAVIFYSLLNLLGYQISLICGYLLSLVVNYFLTIFWTFEAKPNLYNAIGIVASHLFNLFVVRMGLMWLFVEHFGLKENISYIPTLIISVITNYMIIKYVVKKSNCATSPRRGG